MMGGLRGRLRISTVWLVATPSHTIVTAIVNLLVCGTLYSIIEDRGPIDGIWWGIVTGSTVGYGDFYPTHTLGRLVAAYLIISMIVLVACFTAHVTAWLLPDPNVFTHAEQEQIKSDLALVLEHQEEILRNQRALQNHSSAEESRRSEPAGKPKRVE